MHTIFLGYSRSLTGAEMRKLFDIDPEHPDGLSKFEQFSGCGYVEPGNFEVYDRLEYADYVFDGDFIEKLLPFRFDVSILKSIDFSDVISFFYIKTENISSFEFIAVKVVGPILVDKFYYE